MKGLLLAILIIDLPPTPYEPPQVCFDGYEMSDSNECIRVELQSCKLQSVKSCDFKCYMRKHRWSGHWWKHRHHKWNRCNNKLSRILYGVKEVIIRDDGEVVAESECERQ